MVAAGQVVESLLPAALRLDTECLHRLRHPRHPLSPRLQSARTPTPTRDSLVTGSGPPPPRISKAIPLAGGDRQSRPMSAPGVATRMALIKAQFTLCQTVAGTPMVFPVSALLTPFRKCRLSSPNSQIHASLHTILWCRSRRRGAINLAICRQSAID